MWTFFIAIAALITGYFLYGRWMERLFEADPKRQTPAFSKEDGVDFQPMPLWKVFLIEFLNIAGLGPIFGAVLGALYGPMAFLWIVIGCIFMGAVHDYFSGMLSLRMGGASIPEVVGKYLGPAGRQAMRILSLLLLLIVGVAFVAGPADLLTSYTGGGLVYWLYGIFAYYLLATLLPIDKIIGRVYPIFGIVLMIMALGVAGTMLLGEFSGSVQMPELHWRHLSNAHYQPEVHLLFPMLFIVISCGALSGFHSTQAPMMARTLSNEKEGRMAFYGAMIAEGILAMIWAMAAMTYFGDVEGLNREMQIAGHGPAWVVSEICNSWMGKVGGLLALIGVVACPISTGDTAFRSARLILADIFQWDQGAIKNRLMISIPLFLLAFFMSQLDFTTIWKYLGITNQLLAVLVLWTIAVYLQRSEKIHWISSIPATFMSVVCSAYLLGAPLSQGGLGLPANWFYPLSIIFGLALLLIFLYTGRIKAQQQKVYRYKKSLQS
ncbi:carbon starvation protein A [Persicobacter diffluens]|uniref:Carbon starvation protein CstA n=1 Tax=Persicobacter diffluens TaxID=981 RepID=A0AAN4VU06_9BACT|nr:carbon starvation protein CstA [Persicobacter diffluens]